MTHPFHPLAAVLLMCAGIGSGCAEDGADERRSSNPDHYTYIDAAFLSGGGFMSGADAYAAHEAAEREGARSRAAKAGLRESDVHFSRTEYLFLSGAAFYSGPEGYPFSW